MSTAGSAIRQGKLLKLVIVGFAVSMTVLFATASFARADSVEVLVGPGGLTDPRQLTGRSIEYASALAKLSDGSILIGDSQYNLELSPETGGPSRVFKLTPDGTLSVLLGPGGQVDPSQTPVGPLDYVCGIAQLSDGSIAFADTNNDRIIKLARDGTTLSILVGGDGATVNAEAATGKSLSQPQGLLVKRNGALLIADSNRSRILELSPDQPTLTELVGPGARIHPVGELGDDNTPGLRPSRLELLPNGSVAVGTWEASVLELHPDNSLTVLAGDNGPVHEPAVELADPCGISLRRNGALLIADSLYGMAQSRFPGRILELSPDRTTLSVLLGRNGSIPIKREVGQLNTPRTILALPDDSVLVADTYNGRVLLVRPNDGFETRLGQLVAAAENAQSEDDVSGVAEQIRLLGVPHTQLVNQLWELQNSYFHVHRVPTDLRPMMSQFSQSIGISAGWRAALSLRKLDRLLGPLVPNWEAQN